MEPLDSCNPCRRTGAPFGAPVVASLFLVCSIGSCASPEVLGDITTTKFRNNSVLLLSAPPGEIASATITSKGCGTVLVDSPSHAATADTGDCPTVVKFSEADLKELLIGDIIASEPIPPRPFTIHFAYAKDVLTEQGQRELEAMVADIASRKVAEIVVYGYTDTVGTDAYNQKLSQMRADAAKRELEKRLLSRLHLAPDAITSQGRGKLRSAGCNDAAPIAEGIADPGHRCVEISVR